MPHTALVFVSRCDTVTISEDKVLFATGTIARLEKQIEDGVCSNKELMVTMQHVRRDGWASEEREGCPEYSLSLSPSLSIPPFSYIPYIHYICQERDRAATRLQKTEERVSDMIKQNTQAQASLFFSFSHLYIPPLHYTLMFLFNFRSSSSGRINEGSSGVECY
jgi:hypothetical protein